MIFRPHRAPFLTMILLILIALSVTMALPLFADEPEHRESMRQSSPVPSAANDIGPMDPVRQDQQALKGTQPPCTSDEPAPQVFDLDYVVNRTVEHNLSLRAYRENVTQASAQVDMAQSMMGLKSRIEGSALCQGPPIHLDLMGMGIVLKTDFNLSGRIVMEKILTTFGKVEHRIIAALSNLKARGEDYEARKSDMILEARKTYFTILKARSTSQVAESYRKMSLEHRDLAQKLYREGIVSKYDVLRAETNLAEAEKNIATAEKYQELSKSTLLVLMNSGKEIPFDVVPHPPMIPHEHISLGELQSLSIINRHEMKSMNDSIAAAKAVVNSAQSLKNPDIAFTAEYGAQTMKITYMPQYSWNAGIALRIPILDGGEEHAKVKEAQSMVAQIELSRQGLEEMIKLEVRKAWLEMREAKLAINAHIREVESSREGYRLARARYAQGVSQAVEMNDALVAYNLAQNNLTGAVYDLNVAVASLEKSVGADLELHAIEMPEIQPNTSEKENVK